MVSSFHIAEYYDIIYQNKNYHEEVKRCLAMGKIDNEALKNVIDIGAGTGGHSAVLSKIAKTVTAVEIDPKMAMKGMVNTQQRENIDWVVCDITDLKVRAQYSHAFALFNVINYVESEEKLDAFFLKICNCLEPQGLFFFDVWNSNNLRIGSATETRKIDGLDIVITTNISDDRTTANLSYSFKDNVSDFSNLNTFEFDIQLWNFSQLQESAYRAGFEFHNKHTQSSSENERVNHISRPLFCMTKTH